MERQVAVYQGDEMVCLGTVEECAEELGVRPKTIRYYLTPTYQRRYDAYKRPERARYVVEVEEDD